MVLKFAASLAVFVVLSLLLGRWLLNKASGDRREPLSPPAAVVAPATDPQLRVAGGRPLPTTPLTLRAASAPWWEDLAWLLGLWLAALILLGDPALLWTRWLAWPLAIALLLGSAVPALSALATWRAGLEAGPQGVTWHDGTGLRQQVAWSQVGGVTLRSYYGRRATRQGLNAPSSRVLERQTLLLTDPAGAPLLEVDAPLRPAEAFEQLLDAVPHWAGVPVRTEEQTRE